MDIDGKLFKKFLERQGTYERQHEEFAAEKQHSKGKLTARERIELLFDSNTFDEIDAFSLPSPSGGEFGRIVTSYGDGVLIADWHLHMLRILQ